VWSTDGELVVSGSVDCTIRVWRPLPGLALAVCETPGLSVQRVLIADDKRTIVAVAGHCVSPKLVMLHVTRTPRHALPPSHPAQLADISPTRTISS